MNRFREIVTALNRQYRIVPVLYGSLGLSRLMPGEITVNDIDILVPDEYLENRWDELRDTVKALGYTLMSVTDRQFERTGQQVQFAPISDLDDIDLELKDLVITEEKHACYYELDLEQYRAVYEFCLADDERTDKEKDTAMLHMIDRHRETDSDL